MKTYLLLFCIAYVNAQLGELMSGSFVHLGPYHATIKIGNLSERYAPLGNSDLKASRNARSLIEEARRMFSVGFYTLPPVDPYFKPRLPPVDVNNNLVPMTGKVHINNCEVTGAKKFRQKLLELRLKTGRVDFGFTLPHLLINVDLETEMLFSSILPLNLKGHLRLSLNRLSVQGAVQAVTKGLNNSRIYQLAALHSRLHIDDVALQFKGTKFDVSEILRTNPAPSSVSLSDLVDKLKDQINKYAAEFVLHEINKVLTGATVPQVLAYLLPENVPDAN